jgi:D-glycero-alpha-D-manno-heptose-7-phosphate kinase
MRRMVDEAVGILGGGELDDFGRLLGESWALKRQLSRAVTTSAVDRMYQTAMEHGALGGKLLGAGGTGFMLFYAPPERQAEIIASLPTCVHVPFAFESEGSAIIYYAPTETLTALERAMQAA